MAETPNKNVLISDNEIQRDLTNKFLNGELTFTEYSEQWKGDGFLEDDEQPVSDDEDSDDSASGNLVIDDPQSSTSAHKGSVSNNKVTKVRRKRHFLPPALMGLMGEANLRYARGDKEMAEQMCLEIIRQMPTASEPFQTLAQIYENDPEKSLQFSLLAAHLNPSDPELWMKLAAISKERGDCKHELVCYTRAITANPKNVSYHLIRLEKIKEIEEQNLALPSINLTSQQCYMRMIQFLPETDGSEVLRIAKMLAQHYHSDDNIQKALKAMDIAYDKCPNLFSLEDMNLYLELLISQKNYEKCLHLFVTKGGVDIEAEVQTISDGDTVEDITQIISCTLPDTMPIDLCSKLMICLIHMKAYHLIDSLLDIILQTEAAETVGDIFLDIEEALTSEGRHAEALRLLKPLVNSSRYGLAAVWLKYADCLIALQRTDEAIEPLKTVVRLAPQHLDARMKLCNLLKEENRIDEALVALEQDEQKHILDTSLLYEKCQMHKSRGELDNYLNVAQVLLGRHFFKIRRQEELSCFRVRDTQELLKNMREARGESYIEEDTPTFDETQNRLTLKMEWDLLLDVLKVAMTLKYYGFCERMAFSAIGCKKFTYYRHSLEFICLLSSIANNDFYNAYNFARDFVQRSPEKPRVWNLLNLVFQRVEDTRHYKFLVRYLSKFENAEKQLSILHGNNCLMSRNYRYAIKEYISAYKEKPSSLSALLCGLTLLHMACQRFVQNKHTFVVQGLAFMGYYDKLRGPDGKQEVYYNFGRVYHLLGLLPMAIQYYNKALEVDIQLVKDNSDMLDLRCEIAFNMYLIYKTHAPDLARMYLEKYIVI